METKSDKYLNLIVVTIVILMVLQGLPFVNFK